MGVPTAIIANPLDGSEFLWLLQEKQRKLILVTTLLKAATDGVVAAQDALTALSTQIGADEKTAAALAQTVASLSSALDGITKRVATLEGKASPVQHFSASLTLPTVAALSSKTLTATVSGLKAGDLVLVQPATALPSGVTMNYARVPADSTLEVAFDAVLAVSTASTVTFNVAALR